MSCRNELAEMALMAVAWNSTTGIAVPAGEWRTTGGATQGRGWLEVRGKTGNLQVVPGVQFANDPRSPVTPATAVGSAASADGVTDPTGWNALSAGSYKYWRPVYILGLSSGSTLATAVVSGAVEVDGG